jgi:hypothetical protein
MRKRMTKTDREKLRGLAASYPPATIMREIKAAFRATTRKAGRPRLSKADQLTLMHLSAIGMELGIASGLNKKAAAAQTAARFYGLGEPSVIEKNANKFFKKLAALPPEVTARWRAQVQRLPKPDGGRWRVGRRRPKKRI